MPSKTRTLPIAALVALSCLPIGAVAAEAPKVPVALAWGPAGRLYVALREARRVVAVDPATWRVEAGWDLGFRPSALALADDGATLLVGGCDGALAALRPDAGTVRGLPPGRGVTRVAALSDGRLAAGSTWDGAVRVVDWRAGRILAVHPLPFAPGALVATRGGRVVVADAFGDRLAELDPEHVGSARVRTLEGVNLRGLALSGDGKELLVVHMAQYDSVPITESNIDWGLVLSSRLSAVRLSAFDAPGPRLAARRLTLDGSRHGAADPSALALSPEGTIMLITLSGAHQVMKNDRTLGSPSAGSADLLPIGHNQKLEVLEVGGSPVAIAIDPAGRFAVTADSMADTLSVVRVADLAHETTVHLSAGAVARDAAGRGEALFFDGRRAMDRWMSCASCHVAGHTNGLNFDTKGDGSYGAPKNTPSLLGVGPTAPFTWTGGFAHLSEQVHQSFQTSLKTPGLEETDVADLTAYLESLAPAPAPGPSDTEEARRGARVFEAKKCDACHRPPLYTIAATRDVGLDDGPSGHHRFNPPSLRGVAWTAPYFHDGRAATLADVLDAHTPGTKEPLTDRERADLVAYLRSL